MFTNTYLHYGCHTCAPKSWRNFDASPTLRIQRIPLIGRRLTRAERYPDFPPNVEFGDIVKGLPVPDDSCDAAYCSHVLEHLSLHDCRTALANTFRYLRPGGIFRLVLPDLNSLASAYLRTNHPEASLQFMQRLHLGKEYRDRSLGAFLRDWLGNSAHLWMWDCPSMKAELQRAGFREVRRASFGDWSDPHFGDVEEPHRWTQPGFAEGEEIECLGMECCK